MILRPLTEADADAFGALRLASVRAFPGAFLSTPEEIAARGPGELGHWLKGGTVFGLWPDAQDTLIGVVACRQMQSPLTRHRGEIESMLVCADHHGTGAADRLMQAVKSWATDQRISQLELWVWEGNARAVGFYRRHGFAPIGRLPNAVLRGGVAEHDLMMLCPTAPGRVAGRD